MGAELVFIIFITFMFNVALSCKIFTHLATLLHVATLK
jgi:hypothetical protein